MTTSQPADHAGKPWDIDLCKCCETPCMCLWSWCIPCGFQCMQCIDAKTYSGESKNGVVAFFLAWCLCCFGAGYNRTKVREQYKIEGSFILDCLCEWLMPCCAVTQEWRTVMTKEHGDDKKLIWQVWGGKKGDK